MTGKGFRRLFSIKNIPEGIIKLRELISNYNEKIISPQWGRGFATDIVADINVLKQALINYYTNMIKPWDSQHSIHELIDELGEEYFEKLRKDIRTGAFQFKNSYLQPHMLKNKKNMETGIVLESIKMVLEEIYEKTFSETSHGNRLDKSFHYHSAFNFIRMKFGGVAWVIEGNMNDLFKNYDQNKIITILKERINDQVFIDLIYKAIRSGFIDINKNFQNTLNPDTPETHGLIHKFLTPIISNILLDGFDKYLGKVKLNFDVGVKAKSNPVYRKLSYRMETRPEEKKAGGLCPSQGFALVIRKQILRERIPVNITNDPNYKRFHYIRYAGYFLIGILGSKQDCLNIIKDVNHNLAKSLFLEPSNLIGFKTKLTHFTNDRAYFLGMEIHKTPINKKPIIEKIDKFGKKLNVIQTTRPLLSAPISKIIYVLREKKYCTKTYEPTRVKEFERYTEAMIVKHFNALWVNISNYYSISSNFAALNRVYYILFYSCVLTLASKLNLVTKRKVLRKYGKNLTIKDGKNNVIASMSNWGKPFTKNVNWKFVRPPIGV